ncbi:MAG TPA: cation-efflux pump [Candidatus Edwardsbacteria bacterium]|nr:cation-efflux pump [Candidatus Edwardsbacteria bacterium]
MSESARKDSEKIKVAATSVVAAVFLTGVKLVVGLLTGSLGILSEAAHSALDLGAAVMTLVAVKISDRPADDSHHYGHGKIEGLSAFLEVLLLLATCGWILYEAVHHVLVRHAEIEVNVWSFAVMAVSIVINVSRSTVMYKVARREQSQALEADALHFSSDIWSSAVVIVGLAGYKFLHWALADSVAALAVAVLVIVVSIQLALRTLDMLLDRAPRGMKQAIEGAVRGIPGVQSIEALRVRAAGPQTFVDMRLLIDAELQFVQAHDIASAAERAVSQLIPGADVVIHADPAAAASARYDPRQQLSTLLAAHREMFAGYHDLSIVRHNDSYLVNMHIEMSPDAHLSEVHKVCDHLERDIKQRLPGSTVTIHVEPSRKKKRH